MMWFIICDLIFMRLAGDFSSFLRLQSARWITIEDCCTNSRPSYVELVYAITEPKKALVAGADSINFVTNFFPFLFVLIQRYHLTETRLSYHRPQVDFATDSKSVIFIQHSQLHFDSFHFHHIIYFFLNHNDILRYSQNF